MTDSANLEKILKEDLLFLAKDPHMHALQFAVFNGIFRNQYRMNSTIIENARDHARELAKTMPSFAWIVKELSPDTAVIAYGVCKTFLYLDEQKVDELLKEFIKICDITREKQKAKDTQGGAASLYNDDIPTIDTHDSDESQVVVKHGAIVNLTVAPPLTTAQQILRAKNANASVLTAEYAALNPTNKKRKQALAINIVPEVASPSPQSADNVPPPPKKYKSVPKVPGTLPALPRLCNVKIGTTDTTTRVTTVSGGNANKKRKVVVDVDDDNDEDESKEQSPPQPQKKKAKNLCVTHKKSTVVVVEKDSDNEADEEEEESNASECVQTTTVERQVATKEIYSEKRKGPPTTADMSVKSRKLPVVCFCGVASGNMDKQVAHVKRDHQNNEGQSFPCSEDCAWYGSNQKSLDTHLHKCHFVQGTYAACPIVCHETFGNKNNKRFYPTLRWTFTEKRGFSGHMRAHAWPLNEIDAEIVRQKQFKDNWEAFVHMPDGVTKDPTVTEAILQRERDAKDRAKNKK